MIARGSTIAAIFVAILSAFEDCPRVADGYVLPAPKFEILQPLGIRVSIPHEKGIGVFSFLGTVQKQDEEWDYDLISGVTYEPRRGMWTIQDEEVNVTNGDEIVYKMFAVVYGLQYIMNGTLIIHVEEYGKPMATRLVFDERFDSLNQSVWGPVVKFPLSPDYEFCIYNNVNTPGITEIVDGVFGIKPLILDDRYGEGTTAFGNMKLEGCASILPAECKRKAAAFNILPPIISARFTTKESFNFRYGEIEIRAKFPEGDWLYPEMWLEPLYDDYDVGYSNARVLLGLARGNDNLINSTSGEIFDSRKLEFGLRIVDYEEVGKLPFDGKGRRNNRFNKMAAFHEKFYITIGLGVGGVRIFPDGTSSSGIAKPWRNLGAKAMLQFWRAKNEWFPSWEHQNGKMTAFKIDYIRVWSFD